MCDNIRLYDNWSYDYLTLWVVVRFNIPLNVLFIFIQDYETIAYNN